MSHSLFIFLLILECLDQDFVSLEYSVLQKECYLTQVGTQAKPILNSVTINYD